MPPPVKQGSLDEPGGLVVKQAVPPSRRDELGQYHGGELPIVMALVGLVAAAGVGYVINKRNEGLERKAAGGGE